MRVSERERERVPADVKVGRLVVQKIPNDGLVFSYLVLHVHFMLLL